MKDQKRLLIASENYCPVVNHIKSLLEPESYSLASFPLDIAGLISSDSIDGVLFSSSAFKQILKQSAVLDLLDSISAGVIFVDLNQTILWGNRHFQDWVQRDEIAESDFYQTLGDVDIEGPDFCPFSTVRRSFGQTRTTIRIGEQFFELYISPKLDKTRGEIRYFVVEMRDVSEMKQVDDVIQKLVEGGRQLSELSPDDLRRMSIADRRELLKTRIESSIREILKYDVVEFRTLNEKTNRLEPLLAFGMTPEAVQRELFAESTNNGITGYVAHNNVPYYCEETLEHKLYLPGVIDARSSLTVPVVYHNKVVGTCNVENLQPGAFTKRDLFFLQLFTKDVAAALHTFDLLSLESERAVLDSVKTISGSLAIPIDKIIQNLCVLLGENAADSSNAGSQNPDSSNDDSPSGDSPDSASPSGKLLQSERLKNILKTARAIRDQIALVGEELVSSSKALHAQNPEHPTLFGKQILTIDKDENNLFAAHNILECLGANVETAPDAITAINMIKATKYDLIVCEIQPAGGMNGYQFLLRLIETFPPDSFIPLLLGQPDGRDFDHVVPQSRSKAKDLGFDIFAIHKPIIEKQLVMNAEKIFREREKFYKKSGNDATALETSPEEPTASRVEGFCANQQTNRFTNWLDKLTQFQTDVPNDDDSPGQTFEAT